MELALDAQRNQTEPGVLPEESWVLLNRPPESVNSLIILLGTITFAMQLCLVLVFLYQCWRYNRQMMQSYSDYLSQGKEVNKEAIQHWQDCSNPYPETPSAPTLWSPSLPFKKYSYDEGDTGQNPAVYFLPQDLMQCP